MAAVDYHLDRAVTFEVLLEIVRQLLVAARDDEQEAVRREVQARWLPSRTQYRTTYRELRTYR